MCEELKVEFLRIASREKIRKYTTAEHIEKTVELMEVSCIWSPIQEVVESSDLRDAKDLYLLAFAETVKADYLLTGDKDLLVLQTHNRTKIMTYKEFETKTKTRSVS
jgi:putative PIN family toxin of toxin-antitoxin system